jgi:Holliday junction resolvasome RuvABC endonuclease subunit
MIRLLLGLEKAPSPHDVADALAVAICHLHTSTGFVAKAEAMATRGSAKRAPAVRSWRDYRP